jgi:predicted dehydrogenase
MIKIAIVGTGGMANGHAGNFIKIPGCKLVSCCDIDLKRAKKFATEHGIPSAFSDVNEMLKSTDIDAVSVVTSDAGHLPVSLAVIKAGKHVLCEKPLALNYKDAKKMADAAKKKGVINMVNFSYRNSSAIQKASKLVQDGELGRILHFEACYLQSWLTSTAWGEWRKNPAWLWRLSTEHGSKGVLGDVGVHIVDFAGFPLGDFASVNCRLKTFKKAPRDKIGKYKLDANDSAVITAEMKNGAIGTIHTTRWATGHANSLYLRIHGEKGAIFVDLDKSYTELQICRGKDINTNSWQTLKCGKTPSIYQRFIKSIKTGKNDAPDFTRGAKVQRVLDKCIESDKTGKIAKI